MNKMKIIVVDDPFRAAYLLRFGQYRETRFKNGRRCYLIQGDSQTLAEENYRYRTGYALVNPLALKESFYLLEELTDQENYEADLLDDEIEELKDPIVIDGEDEELP